MVPESIQLYFLRQRCRWNERNTCSTRAALFNYTSILEDGLWAGGLSLRSTRQGCFFSCKSASSSEASLCLCGDSFTCQIGFVNGNPSGSRSKIRSSKKAFVEEWVFISDVPSEGPSTAEDPMIHNTVHSEYIPVTPRTSEHSTSLPWETTKPQDKACFLGANWGTIASVAATA